MIRRSALALVLVLTLSPALTGCGNKTPPVTNPTTPVVTPQQKAINLLDVMRDAVVSANAQTPPLVSTHVTSVVVQEHQNLVIILQASTAGWKAAVDAGLNQLAATLSPAEYQTIAKYVDAARLLVDALPGV